MGCSTADLLQAQLVNTKMHKPRSTYIRTILPSLPTTRSLFALKKCFAALEAIAPERLTTRAISRRAILEVKHLCLVGATRVKTLFERDYEGLHSTLYAARRGEGECGQGLSSFPSPSFNVPGLVGRRVRRAIVRMKVGSGKDGHCLDGCGSTND